MRCKPCGAPRNPNADRCDYCQSWHEVRTEKRYDFKPGQVIEYKSQPELQSIQARMMANDVQYRIQYGYQSLLGNAGMGALSSYLGRIG